MEMPTTGAEHERLAAFTGTWEGDETISPSPWGEGGPARGRFEYRMGLNGFFLISNYTEEKDGSVVYAGHGVYGYDAANGCYTMHWFDSMGGSYHEPAKGTWHGNSLVFRNATPRGHGRYTHTIGEGTYGFKLEVSKDGEAWSLMMEGSYERT